MGAPPQKNAPVTCTVTDPNQCKTAGCRYRVTINNEDCQRSLRKQAAAQQQLDKPSNKDNPDVYKPYVCAPGRAIGTGNPQCCMILDNGGNILATTGICSNFGDERLQKMIDQTRAKRKDTNEKAIKQKAEEKQRQKVQACKKIVNEPLNGLSAARQMQQKNNCKTTTIPASQTTTQFLMGKPDVLIAGACVVAGLIIYAV